MKKTLIAIFTVLALAILMTGCSGLQNSTITNEEIRTLNASGTGTVYIVPDIARVTIGVNTQNEDAATALSENTRDVNAVMQTLTNLGVAENDIQTSNFYVYQQTNYNYANMEMDPESEPQTIFVVQNTVFVVVRDINSLGEILAAVVDQGANTINGVSFDIEDSTAAYAEAQQKAIDDAASQAQEIADAAGVELGEITYINVSDGYTAPADSVMAAYGGGGSVPVSSGTLTIQVTASITYTFK